MIVTPVAKHPMARRNSREFKVILSPFAKRADVAPRFWVAQRFHRCDLKSFDPSGFPAAELELPFQTSPLGRNRIHYHASPLYHSSQGVRHAHYARHIRTFLGKCLRAGKIASGCPHIS